MAKQTKKVSEENHQGTQTAAVVQPSAPAPATKAQAAISNVAAGGPEVRELVKKWHEEGKKLDKKALVEQLQQMFPNPVSPKTGQAFGEAGWHNGVTSVIQDLRSKGEIPYERKQGEHGGGGNGKGKTEPTLGDLKVVNEFLSRKRMTIGDFLDYVQEVEDLCSKVGGFSDLKACAKAIEEFSS